jgi:hypothetical protein
MMTCTSPAGAGSRPADAEAVREVAGNDADAALDVIVEGIAEFALEAIEDAGLEQLAAEAFLGRDGAVAALGVGSGGRDGRRAGCGETSPPKLCRGSLSSR